MPEGAARHFTITRATIDDADGILGCLRTAFESYRAQYTPAAYEDTVMNAATARQRIETMKVLVARGEQGTVVGTVGATVRGREGHIRGMAVVPAAQGMGVADQLIESMEGELSAAGCSFVTLDTTVPLVRAIRFYERHGYVRSGTIGDFFGMPLHEFRKYLR